MKSEAIELVIITKKQNAATDSLRVAKGFGKSHKNVLRAIDNLECDEEFSRLNFAPIEYVDGRGRTQRKWVMSRAGFVFLVMGFTGKRAAQFKQQYIAEFDRVEAELLRQRPATGSVDLLAHTRRETQINNSKEINRRMIEAGGPRAAEAYNRQNCILHTGRRPAELKEEARLRGVPAKARTSAKELLRHERPAAACAMSLADELVIHGSALPEAAAVTRQAIPVFEGLMRLGFTPKQLTQ